jgi:hypothetical protein
LRYTALGDADRRIRLWSRWDLAAASLTSPIEIDGDTLALTDGVVNVPAGGSVVLKRFRPIRCI